MSFVRHNLRSGCAALCAAAALLAPTTSSGQVITPPSKPTSIAGEFAFPKPPTTQAVSQLGLAGWAYWSLEEPFIDQTKMTGLGWTADFPTAPSMLWNELWNAGHIDKTSLYPKSMPAGASRIRGGVIRQPAWARPAAFNDRYVLTWQGNADLRFSLGVCSTVGQTNCQTPISPNRVVANFLNYPDHVIWEITAIRSPITKIQIYRESNEVDLLAGQLVTDSFREHARRYHILRFLNPQEASQARPFRAGDFVSTGAATDIPLTDVGSIGAGLVPYNQVPSDAPKEVNFATIFKVSKETNTAAWIHIAGLPGAPLSLKDYSYSLNWQTMGDAWRVACKDNLQSILNAPDWGAYGKAIVDGLVAAGYPANRRLYIEPWNEVWNDPLPWGAMTTCADGVADALIPGTPFGRSFGYGYLAAHAMVKIDEAFRNHPTRKKQAWTLVMARHQANEVSTTDSIDGFKRYFLDRGINCTTQAAICTAWLKHVGVSISSYYQNSLDLTNGFIQPPPIDPADHVAKLKQRILAGSASQDRENWIRNSTAGFALPTVLQKRALHNARAIAGGAYFLGDYEGESHEFVPCGSHLLSDPTIGSWLRDWPFSPHGERVTKDWADRLTAQNKKWVISNYISVDRLSPLRCAGEIPEPWVDGYYAVGANGLPNATGMESNGRTRGLAPILRP